MSRLSDHKYVTIKGKKYGESEEKLEESKKVSRDVYRMKSKLCKSVIRKRKVDIVELSSQNSSDKLWEIIRKRGHTSLFWFLNKKK